MIIRKIIYKPTLKTRVAEGNGLLALEYESYEPLAMYWYKVDYENGRSIKFLKRAKKLYDLA